MVPTFQDLAWLEALVPLFMTSNNRLLIKSEVQFLMLVHQSLWYLSAVLSKMLTAPWEFSHATGELCSATCRTS